MVQLGSFKTSKSEWHWLIFRVTLTNRSRSLKVKSDSAFELPTYDFMLVFHSNIWQNYGRTALRNKNLQNLTLTLTFQGHLKSNVML